MKKKLKATLSMLLCAVMVLCSVAVGGMFASADDTVTYEFDSSTGTLTISGTGEVTKDGVSAKVTNSDDLKSVVINDGITSIGESAFEGSESLTSVTMTDSITTIGNDAFYLCEKLKTFTWSKNLTSIGEWAFGWCSLSKLHIPKGLDLIGDWAFYGLESLENISVDPENKNFTVVDGVLFNADKTQLILYPACKEGTSYKVPDTVTTICLGAFCGCEYLTEVIIPDTVTKIGDCAFAYCANLKKINFPKTFEVIPRGMFCGSGIKNITIPSSITEIGYIAFYDCKNLKYVFYASSQEDWKKITISSNNENLTSAVIHYNATGHTLDADGKCTVKNCDYVCDHAESTDKPTCEKSAVCSVCKKEISATGHTFDADGKCTKAECGYVCDHADNTNKATCEKSAVCSICKKELPKLGHDFSGNPIETKATFFKDGSKVYLCTHDGCTETRTEITLSTINRILAWFRNIFSFKF
jgi:hypothetical protein